MLKKNKRRLWLLCVLLLLLGPAVMAQSERTLVPGTPLAGTLDANNLVQVYTLQGSAGQAVTLTVRNQSGVPLALVLTDSVGHDSCAGVTTIDDTGKVTLNNITLPADGDYFVTVFKSAGVELVNLVDFTLTAAEVSAIRRLLQRAARLADATVTPRPHAVPSPLKADSS